MKILKMRLENFLCVKQAEFAFDGRNADIYGNNAAGKTTVFNAFTWLLFGKFSTGEEGTPKSKTANGDAHNLEHSVECETLFDDGGIVTFKRVYKEVYTKKRGKSEANLTGHTTDYFINGVPKKEKEYNQYLENIFADVDAPKLLTMPFYFAEALSSEKRRELLLKICGDVPDAAVIEANPDLKALPDIIGSVSVSEYKKAVKARMADINRKIQLIPARIDEVNRVIADIPDIDAGTLKSQLANLQAEIAGKEKERAALSIGGAQAQSARAKIAELTAELAETRNAHNISTQALTEKLRADIQTINGKLFAAQEAANELKTALQTANRRVSSIESKRKEILDKHAALRGQYSLEQKAVFDENDTVCPSCQRPYDEGKADEIRSAFNLHKSRRLKELAKQMEFLLECGKKEASKEMLTEAQQAAIEAEAAYKAQEIEVEGLLLQGSTAKKQLSETVVPTFEMTDRYKEIQTAIALAKEAEISGTPDTCHFDEEINDMRARENVLIRQQAALAAAEAQITRIEELRTEEKAFGKAYEEAERDLCLCEKFSRAKMSMLTDKINSLFSTVRFQLFKQNITNDGVEDICEALIPSPDGAMIPFKSANSAARVNAGLEIIGVLSEHYEADMPVFVDNAESITSIAPVKGQLIRLIVSEADKVLRLELR